MAAAAPGIPVLLQPLHHAEVDDVEGVAQLLALYQISAEVLYSTVNWLRAVGLEHRCRGQQWRRTRLFLAVPLGWFSGGRHAAPGEGPCFFGVYIQLF